MPARQSVWLRTIFLAGLVLLSRPALAQFDRAQISGVVKDESGGVIPGATVTITNRETRLARTGYTDQTGYYIFTALAPGSYDVEVELTGFKKFAQTGVKLDAAARLTLDATLATGVISEQVLVVATPTPLQFDTQNRKTLEAKDFENLAQNGRNPIGLAMLKAGVRSSNPMKAFLAGSPTNGGFHNKGPPSGGNP